MKRPFCFRSDNVLPRIFLQKIPVTNAPYPALMSFIVLSIALYASCGFSLSIASSLFSLSFIFVMGLVRYTDKFHHRPRTEASSSIYFPLFYCAFVGAASYDLRARCGSS